MDLKEGYQKMGGNYQDVLYRLVDDSRIRRFLGKFMEDGSYDALVNAMAVNDYNTAFRAAHTMKGVCMNLGLTSLGDASATLTDNLRSGEANDETLLLYEKIKQEYDNTITTIQDLLNE